MIWTIAAPLIKELRQTRNTPTAWDNVEHLLEQAVVEYPYLAERDFPAVARAQRAVGTGPDLKIAG